VRRDKFVAAAFVYNSDREKLVVTMFARRCILPVIVEAAGFHADREKLVVAAFA
jgi:hypothetical protein